MEDREQPPTDLGSALLHSYITAQTGGTAIVPQLHGCNVAGDINFNVYPQSDNKGKEGFFFAYM